MDQRQAAICWVIEVMNCTAFIRNEEERALMYVTVRQLQSVLNEEYPAWDMVLAAPNGFPSDWRKDVRRSEVFKILQEFNIRGVGSPI